jgi:hypothetical protein
MVERSRILPSLPERDIEISDCWSADLQLRVVPRRTWAVPMVELDGLGVSLVAAVISSSMAEVDPPDECHVTLGRGGVADDNELLVVRAASPHSLVEQHFPACLGDLEGETPIVLRAEREPITVRTPEQPADVSATSAQTCKECRNRRTAIGHLLVPVSSPVGKAHLLVGPETRDDCGQASKIRGTLHQELDMVAFGPRDTPWPTRVDPGRRVASFFG